MTNRLERAIEAARELPAEMQDEIADVLLSFIGKDDDEIYELTPEEEADLEEAEREIGRGELVGEIAVRALLAKYIR